jgi:hypothetical protein
MGSILGDTQVITIRLTELTQMNIGDRLGLNESSFDLRGFLIDP